MNATQCFSMGNNSLIEEVSLQPYDKKRLTGISPVQISATLLPRLFTALKVMFSKQVPGN